MVRMDHPSPFQVGREFVRQYYSLLNKAPEFLHRFYGVNSSYVHGNRYLNGEPEEEVVGQMEIHKKITSLGFKECHTKVYQVDAHSTIGNGVVVQVVGELSNNRKPLRRFMQTFVLAPQGDNPYKFYVHNDIFRYEDEVYRDELPSERPEEQGPEVEEEQAEGDRQPPAHFENHVGVSNQPQHIVNNGIEQHLDSPVNVDNRPSPAPATPPPNHPPADTPPLEPAQETAASIETEPRVETPDFPAVDEKREPHFDMAERDIDVSENNAPVKENESSQVFSWAALASKNTPVQHNIQQGTVVKVGQSQDNVATLDHQQKPRPRSATRPPPPPQREDSGDGAGDAGARRSIRYPDSQQIFVGNLPYDIAEADLREHFVAYGEIIEVRINHSNTSNPSFGFIIFEDPKSVEEVLQLMPTTFKNNKRINIEEKKQRAMSRDGRRGGPGGWDARRDNRGGGRMQQRGPPRRDWGGPREGQRPNNFPPRR